MNGHLVSVLFWVAQAALGLLVMLVGVIGNMHIRSDEEHRRQFAEHVERLEQEILRLRDRLHELQSKVSGLEMLETTRGRRDERG